MQPRGHQKDVFITTWPEVVWNGAQGLGSRPEKVLLLLKLGTYPQPTPDQHSSTPTPVSWTGSARESHPLVTSQSMSVLAPTAGTCRSRRNGSCSPGIHFIGVGPRLTGVVTYSHSWEVAGWGLHSDRGALCTRCIRSEVLTPPRFSLQVFLPSPLTSQYP